jgi:hypothetical protein
MNYKRFILVSTLFISLPPIAAQAQTSLESYTLFSTQSTFIKDRTCVRGPIRSNSYIEYGIEAQHYGDAYCAGNVFIKDRSKVFGSITANGTVSIINNGYVEGPIVKGNVTLLSIAPKTVPTGAANITINSGSSYTLSPGYYNEVIVNSNAKLILGDGAYTMKALKIEADAQIEITVNSGVNLNISSTFYFQDRSVVRLLGSFNPKKVLVYSNQYTQLRIGANTKVNLCVSAPNAEVYVASRAVIKGRLAAKIITVDADANIETIEDMRYVDSDRDNVPDVIESTLGYNPTNPSNKPLVAMPIRISDAGGASRTTPVLEGWLNTPGAEKRVILSVPLPGVNPIPFVIPAGTVTSDNIPIMELVRTSSVPSYPSGANTRALSAYDIKGTIAAGANILFPFPYSPRTGDKIGMSNFQVLHYNSGISKWENVPVEKVAPGVVWARVSSFSKYITLSTSNVVFVDWRTKTSRDGKSWETAFATVQEGLQVAKALNAPTDVWVASGTYKPGTAGQRDKTFNLTTKLCLLGGFAGTESNYNDRNPAANITILSGDLDGDGTHNDQDAFSVLTLSEYSPDLFQTTVDGFNIEGGNAYGPTTWGGGLYLSGAAGEQNLAISNCAFRNNAAVFGGAIYNTQNNGNHFLYLKNCTFENNTTYYLGGAICLNASSGHPGWAFIDLCTFSDNVGPGAGGALYCNGSGANISRSLFNHNAGGAGAAINIVNSPSDPPVEVDNCVFTRNSALFSGSTVISNENGILQCTNCTFTGNIQCPAVTTEYGTPLASLSNCILWGNNSGTGPEIRLGSAGSLTIKNCDVENGISGIVTGGATVNDQGGNISSTPELRDMTNCLGADGKFGTLDDGMFLKLGSPCHGTGDLASAPAFDILGTAKPGSGNADIGAYYMLNPVNPSFAVDFLACAGTNYGFDRISHTLPTIHNPNEIYISLPQTAGAQTKVRVILSGSPQNYYAKSSDESIFTIAGATGNSYPLNNGNISELTLVSQNPSQSHAHATLQIMDAGTTMLRALNVEVYKERILNYVFNRIVDPSSPLTQFKEYTKQAAEDLINKPLKQALVKLNFASYNNEVDINFDANKNGFIDNYFYVAGTSISDFSMNPEVDAINNTPGLSRGNGTFTAYGGYAGASLILDQNANKDDQFIIVAKEQVVSDKDYWFIGPGTDGSAPEVIYISEKQVNFDGSGRTRLMLTEKLNHSYLKTLQPDPNNSGKRILSGASVTYLVGGGQAAGLSGTGSVAIMRSFPDGLYDNVLWPHEVFHAFQTDHTVDPEPGMSNLMLPSCGDNLRFRPICVYDDASRTIQQWNAVDPYR